MRPRRELLDGPAP
uniref:Uncharacterized protein n=1 Tax=Arundo donax TaxID=35708 RepID=A0A0A9BKK0_ARUDO